MPYRVCVIVRGQPYNSTIVGPWTGERPDAVEAIAKIREAQRASGNPETTATRWVDLDWLSMDAGDVLAAYVAEETEVIGYPGDVGGPPSTDPYPPG